MRQNTPNRILNFKNFPGVTPGPSQMGAPPPDPPSGPTVVANTTFR